MALRGVAIVVFSSLVRRSSGDRSGLRDSTFLRGDAMKAEILSGLGALMLVLPGLSLGASFLDHEVWPPLSDPRWFAVALGLLLMAAARVLYRRELAGRD